MLEHYKLLLNKMALPPDALADLTATADALLPAREAELSALIQRFYSAGCSMRLMEEPLAALAQEVGLNPFTLHFVFMACASKRMLADFRAKGYGDGLFWDTIMDLKYKLFECKTVKGVWGNFVSFWYDIFFTLNIFKLGRLEFERMAYDREEPYRFGGLTLNKGDTVYSVHIPSCGPLSRELRMDAYRRAYDFFAAERRGRPLICVCHSWLLYSKNREIFPPNINLVDFMGDWDIIESCESENFDDAWRVFGQDFTGDVSALPQNSSQQKALARWLAAGNKTGEGFGVLIFDGKSLVNARP